MRWRKTLPTPTPTPIATEVVTNTNDSGPGSLRRAISDAAPGETITFAVGVTGTIPLTSGSLVITKALNIQGPGAAVLTVSGNNSVDVFELGDSIVVVMSGLTIADARFGIFGQSFHGRTTLSNLVITRNISDGIATGSDISVSDSTITANGNSGLFAEFDSVTINRCTISHNRSPSGGGGIHLHNASALVRNCTIANNSTTYSGQGLGGYGGGIEISSGSLATIASCSIVDNSASAAGGGLSGDGLALFNTIVARNHMNQNPSDIDPSFPVNGASSYNLIGLGGSGGLVNEVNHNQVGVANSGLGSLGDNGGPTQTVSLMRLMFMAATTARYKTARHSRQA